MPDWGREMVVPEVMASDSKQSQNLRSLLSSPFTIQQEPPTTGLSPSESERLTGAWPRSARAFESDGRKSSWMKEAKGLSSSLGLAAGFALPSPAGLVSPFGLAGVSLTGCRSLAGL